MVTLDAGKLDTVGHDVQDVFALHLVGNHALDVFQPRAGVTRHRLGAGIAPAVGEYLSLTGAQHGLARSVGQPGESMRTHRLPVLVERHRRLHLAFRVVDAAALNVPE